MPPSLVEDGANNLASSSSRHHRACITNLVFLSLCARSISSLSPNRCCYSRTTNDFPYTYCASLRSSQSQNVAKTPTGLIDKELAIWRAAVSVSSRNLSWESGVAHTHTHIHAWGLWFREDRGELWIWAEAQPLRQQMGWTRRRFWVRKQPLSTCGFSDLFFLLNPNFALILHTICPLPLECYRFQSSQLQTCMLCVVSFESLF